MKDYIDLHTHSVLSTHAYSTIQENIQHAASIGLKYYGISDHAPGITGGQHIFAISNLRIIPNFINGVRILKGVELNIMDSLGKVDVEDYYLRNTDYCIASLHTPCYSTKHTYEDNTNAYLNVLNNQRVKILGHIDDGRYLCDYKKVIKACKEHNVLVEINNASLINGTTRVDGPQHAKEILKICKEVGCVVILSSDAHISFSVGDHSQALKLLDEVNFPSELVFNFNEDMIQKYFEM